MEPRRDQLATLDEVREAFRKYQSVLLHAACGWGKTVASAYVAKAAQEKNKRVIFGVHRRELVRQTARTFYSFGIDFGFIASGFQTDPFARVQIATRQSLIRRPELMKSDLFVPDEAHLWASDTGETLINLAREHGHIMPLTATPQQGNGKGLANIADYMVHGPSEKWLIGQGHLARYRLFCPVAPDLSGVPKRGGEYAPKGVDALLGKPTVTGDRVAAYREYAYGKRHIGYCYSRENGEETAEAFRRAGIPAAFVDGETPDDERVRIITAFADREILVLLNCQLFREGFDLSAQVGRPVPIESVGLYAPTCSLPLAVQMMMRPMRPQPEPAIIIDHVNIIRDHGLPDDERAWSLDGTVKNHRLAAEQRVRITKCPACFRSFPPFIVCPGCGVERTVDGRHVKEVDGVIQEVDIEALRRSRKFDVNAARDIPSLCRIAKDRGYAAGWVAKTLIARGEKIDWRAIETAMRA